MTRIDLEFTPRPWQADVLREMRRFSVVVVHRQGGKTELAIMKLNDAALRSRRERARFGYVAPLLKQAKAVVWDRLKAYARKVPGTVINESELSVEFANGARIRLFGADNPDALRGLVFDGLVLDEVAQLPPALWGEVLLPTLAERDGWALFIGTPKGINLFSTLYYKALDDPTWFAARYDSHQTGALSPDAIAQVQRESTDAQFRQEMLCDFAAVNDNNLIPLDAAMAASRRRLEPSAYGYAPRVMGVDVAWSGGDRSVIAPRQGLMMSRPVIERGLPEKSFAGRVAGAIVRWQPDAVFVDTTGGYGGEVVSRLRDAGHSVTDVVFSWKASDERFRNLRAEMWWKLSEWIKGGASIPPIPELLSELCAPQYSHDNAANKLTLESKDEIRARIGASVDIADALALTFAFPVATAGARGGVGHALTEYDPYDERELPRRR
jgi:phage terminase large subunit-like protein